MSETSEIELDKILINQLTWKPCATTSAAITIVITVANKPYYVYPDAVDLSFICNADKNVIGSAWRNLTRQGIIKHGINFRRSKSKESKGRTIFSYTLASRK